jgi:hypothetical protein
MSRSWCLSGGYVRPVFRCAETSRVLGLAMGARDVDTAGTAGSAARRTSGTAGGFFL